MKLTKEQFDLLRPIKLGAALKLGSKVYVLSGQPYEATIMCGPDSYNMVCIKYTDEYDEALAIRSINNLRISPEAWIQGKPAYVGDKVYGRGIPGEVFIAGRFGNTAGLDRKVQISVLSDKKTDTWVTHTGLVENMSWTPFTVKKEGWVVLVRNANNNVGSTPVVHDSYCKAEDHVNMIKECLHTHITTVGISKVEWEEEV